MRLFVFELINQSPGSLCRDESCGKLADLLLKLLQSFNDTLIESMLQNHPWLRAFEDEAFTIDAAVYAMETDTGSSLLILRSYLLLMTFRIFVKRLHLSFTSHVHVYMWHLLCSEIVQCLRKYPAHYIWTSLFVLLQDEPCIQVADNATRRLIEDPNTISRNVEGFPYHFTRSAPVDPITDLYRLKT